MTKGYWKLTNNVALGLLAENPFSQRWKQEAQTVTNQLRSSKLLKKWNLSHCQKVLIIDYKYENSKKWYKLSKQDLKKMGFNSNDRKQLMNLSNVGFI